MFGDLEIGSVYDEVGNKDYERNDLSSYISDDSKVTGPAFTEEIFNMLVKANEVLNMRDADNDILYNYVSVMFSKILNFSFSGGHLWSLIWP